MKVHESEKLLGSFVVTKRIKKKPRRDQTPVLLKPPSITSRFTIFNLQMDTQSGSRDSEWTTQILQREHAEQQVQK